MATEADPSDIRRRIRQKSKLQDVDSDDYDFTDDVYPQKFRPNRQNKKRTRRHNYNKNLFEEDEDYSNELFPKWKLALVIGVICVCFALLFPTVFNPLLNAILGRHNVGDDRATPKHTPMAGRSPSPSRGGPSLHPAAASQMRMPPPHADLKGAQTGGGRGGMFTWMMPFYTIGVVGFLGFTLYKIMFKQKKKRKGRHYDDDSEEYDSDTVAGEIGQRKLRAVQRRLQKTEEAMRQILEQLENIAQSTDLNVIDTHTDSNDPADKDDENLKKNDPSTCLNNTQVLEVERGLHELRELSDLYKKQQEEMNEAHGIYEDYDDRDDASQSIVTESEDDEMMEYTELASTNVLGKDVESVNAVQIQSSENDVNNNVEEIIPSSHVQSNKNLNYATKIDNSTVTKSTNGDMVNNGVKNEQRTKNETKQKVRRRLRKR